MVEKVFLFLPSQDITRFTWNGKTTKKMEGLTTMSKDGLYDRIKEAIIVDPEKSETRRRAELVDVVAELSELGINIPVFDKKGKVKSSSEIAKYIQTVVFPDPIKAGMITKKGNRTHKLRQTANLVRAFNRLYGADIRLRANYIDPDDMTMRTIEDLQDDMLLVADNVSRNLMATSKKTEGNLDSAIRSIIKHKKLLDAKGKKSLKGLDDIVAQFSIPGGDNTNISQISDKLLELVGRQADAIVALRAESATSVEALTIIKGLIDKQEKDTNKQYLAAAALSIAFNVNKKLSDLLSEFKFDEKEEDADILRRLKASFDAMRDSLERESQFGPQGNDEDLKERREIVSSFRHIIGSFEAIKDTIRDASVGLKAIRDDDGASINVHELEGITEQEIETLKNIQHRENIPWEFFKFEELLAPTDVPRPENEPSSEPKSILEAKMREVYGDIVSEQPLTSPVTVILNRVVDDLVNIHKSNVNEIDEEIDNIIYIVGCLANENSLVVDKDATLVVEFIKDSLDIIISSNKDIKKIANDQDGKLRKLRGMIDAFLSGNKGFGTKFRLKNFNSRFFIFQDRFNSFVGEIQKISGLANLGCQFLQKLLGKLERNNQRIFLNPTDNSNVFKDITGELQCVMREGEKSEDMENVLQSFKKLKGAFDKYDMFNETKSSIGPLLPLAYQNGWKNFISIIGKLVEDK